ncbi:IgGFc-binding protein [Labeo rohita]|uniref:IgGFc-binding protein n=2 Tax=Labeo rohita TaxID=84645 RepID=A0ABQ8MNS0_LABRO|nr:IgGFc-binding protein [Labeo rohita]
MGTYSFLFCLAVLTVTVSGCPVGREFITAFMTNYQYGKASLSVSITAQNAPATVKIEIKALSYSETVSIGRGETRKVILPQNAEIEGDGTFRKTVYISSNADITVASANLKEFTGDTTVLLPVNELGKRYVVFTPNTGPSPYKKEIAIINGNSQNTISILSGKKNLWTLFFGRTKTITLAPYEVYLQRSADTLTGMQITSKFPVAVLAGHECSMIVGTCEHIFEQLVPVESLSNEYLIPAMHQSSSQDKAYVVAPDDNTVVSIFTRHSYYSTKRNLNAGEVYAVDVSNNAAMIRSNKKVMVMYLSSNYPNDEFLTNLIPTSEMSKSWTIHPQDGFDSTVVVVAEAASASSISGSFKWKKFTANEKFVWANRPLGLQKGPITISGNSLMAVYVFGGKVRHGYGSTGVCNTGFTQTPVPVDPCENVKCRQQEVCKKGVCVPTATVTCHAVGDPHYKTFDGKLFDFQGTCTYVMVNNTKIQNGLTPFTILAKNNNRGSKRVAYVRTVSVLVYNHEVVVGGKKGVVEIDGENAYLPLTIDGGKIKVNQRGWNVIISTDFGLEVTYDWNMMLYITAPNSYFQTVGGLCGNYNGDQKDEYVDPKGKVLTNIIDFAKSWKFPDNDLFCTDECNGECPSCSPNLQEEYRKETNCGVMTKKDGPFAVCHNTVDPQMYVDNCVYDVCINNGRRNFLCNNIQSYVGACMSAGIKIVGNWRTDANCPLDCPVNMHYEACGTACAASCADQNAPNKCTVPCVEGCQCNAGFVRSGDECIPVKNCGCTYKDRYYPAEQTFWGNQKCTEKCVCKNGKVDCTAAKCKKSEACDTRNGVRDCYPTSYSTCQAAGDPHYRTFDGKAFDFQGTCTYYLSKLINTADPSLVPFEVLVKNENRGRNMAVSFTKTVSLTVYGHTIVLSKDDPGKVKVNNLFVNLPFEQEEGRFSIFYSGFSGVVKTDFDLTLNFNWESHVELKLPSTYSGEVGGLCGNWNNNANDDFLTPAKTPAATPTIFGSSWKVKNDPACSDECQGNACPKCDGPAKNLVTFTKPCSMITDKQGPFKDCHIKVNPNQFYEDCLYDMCMYNGHSTALCGALTAYTAACQKALGTVESWRTNNFCPSSCMENSHYEVCATGCSQTCNGLTQPEACKDTPCVEGCVCDEGFVLSNGECVAIERCGCSYEGRYYQLGQKFFPQDKCKQRCVCKENGRVQCDDAFTCKANEKCQVLDGVQGCFPEGKAVCSVSGFGLYQSFDGRSFAVEGDCEYRMAETVEDEDEDISFFSLAVKQQSSEPAFTRRVIIQIEDTEITLLPGSIWEVQVDNVKTNLPATLDEGLIEVYQSGVNIIVETNFGLKLTYDTVSMVKIEILSTFKNIVKGLCGNYNENSADDFLLPGGLQTISVVDFAHAWVSPSYKLTCQTTCGPKCLNPDKDKQKEAEKVCGLLISEKGPFSTCYAKIPPQKYFEECVKDVAVQPNDKSAHCRHIQRYVTSCQEIGTSVSIWRNNTFCPLTCLKNSHYELCADTCTSTCASLTKSQKCPLCQEGCQCNDGFLFDGGECRTLDSCGCNVDRTFYKSGQIVIREECAEKCTCKAGVFTCEPMECNEDQVCGIKNGATGCYDKNTYCPANMHFDACATACPATCVDRDGSEDCTKACTEGCVCNDGFVRSGDDCISVKKCGCSYKGRYYLPNEAFWGEKQCTEKCVCNPQTGNVECTSSKCNPGLLCGTRNGVKDCYPLSYSTCQAAGDPHYHTFDGKSFNFQGTCTYYLSKVLNTADPSLIPFEVLVSNDNRGGNKGVSFTKTVSLTVYGHTIVLSKESPQKVKVNNLFVKLPFEGQDGRISIFYSGNFGVIKTDFGLTLKFNWESHVMLILPSTYSGEVGGLCGNWNDNADDDFLTPNNNFAATPTIFGTSWKVTNDTDCSDGCKGSACSKCDAAERNQDTFTKPCSKILDKQGPFKGCHDKVNPAEFYEDCVYDMCMYGGQQPALCSALAAYTAACQDALGKVESWRTNNFCPTTCKANSHYEICATGCLQTCRGLTEPKNCKGTPCVEGCTCDKGFVLSDGECVAAQQCGCVYKGLYYQLGQDFFPQDNCKQRCTCKENGKVQCDDGFTCKSNEKCQFLDGVQGCFPEGKGVCTVLGFGIYQSFDGRSFTVEGDCEYRMVETTQNQNQKNSFNVLVKQQSSEPVFTRRVEVQIGETKITLLPGHIWEVQVDKVKTSLPATLNEGLVQVYQSGVNIIVKTNFGLKLAYDTVSMVRIEIPSNFKNAVKGVCGDYNGNSEDDFRLPGGIQTTSAEYFAEGWVSPSDKQMCHTGCGSKCLDPGKDKQKEAEIDCRMLIPDKGPFSSCYLKIPPQKFFEQCVKDVAAQPNDKTVHCQHIQRYVAICQENGILINIWRNNTFCPLQCSGNSHYELCTDTCGSSCASLTKLQKCPPCQEGCQCDDGFAFDGGECKPLQECGCAVKGKFYKSGQTIVMEKCAEKCLCKAGVFSCQPMKCDANQICDSQDGVVGCYNRDPCTNFVCREQEQCTVQNNRAMCVAKSKASCIAKGDPHYKTFDGNHFSFQGTCSYTLVKTSGKDQTLTPFKIINKNDFLKGTRGSYVRSATITVKEREITFIRGSRNRVTVDGTILNLPVFLNSEKISITLSGAIGILQTDFGLEVQYNWADTFMVTLSSSYYNNVVGMCGTYNNVVEDDYITPNGNGITDIAEWAKSWSVPESNSSCWHFPPCSDVNKLQYSGPTYCGLLFKESGPFAQCRDVITKRRFADDCLFQMCLNDGTQKSFCTSLNHYARACALVKADVSPEWTTLANCCK